MDKLIIKGLRFHGLHGVFEQEKITGNLFEVDLAFTLSLQKAGETDDLTETVDYAKARSFVEEIIKSSPMNLIETISLKIGEALFHEFEPDLLEVKVRKLNPPMEGETEYSEVTMQWPR
ncbi:MAG: dihydroneopterin aldolase [Bacteroidetes bacterium]|jgi:dihydroneopterin aldolase|nr:dihydroneopterin aldolase [Bacteroidota bacterium]MAB66573.1 dihydroneopterin aldolase [Bacteroidota bacterium]HCI69299.1 dihydroneopterin aldolase [Balneola sp.]|tara:strand:+ start:96 stop:452 length:357 start_codon:yes stop_codon:yes gene_type:complete